MVRVKVSHGEGEDRRIIRIHLETMTPALLRGFFGIESSASVFLTVKGEDGEDELVPEEQWEQMTADAATLVVVRSLNPVIASPPVHHNHAFLGALNGIPLPPAALGTPGGMVGNPPPAARRPKRTSTASSSQSQDEDLYAFIPVIKAYLEGDFLRKVVLSSEKKQLKIRIDDVDIHKSKLLRGSSRLYAEATLPDCLTLGKSRIPDAGIGVFAKEPLQPPLAFGPYMGEKRDTFEEADASGYSWEVQGSGSKPSFWVDGGDERTANWMRFVNHATDKSQQSLEAVEFKGEIYYFLRRGVEEGEELLVSYGDDYGATLADQHRPKVHNTALRPPTPQVSPFALLCPHCSTGYSADAFLQAHIRTCRQRPKEFACPKCPSSFSEAFRVKAHLKTVHEAPAFKCSECKKAFIQACDLKRHMRTHTGEKPYKCQQCDAAFAKSDDLTRHVMTHTGAQPHACSQCNAKFITVSHLYSHTKTVHDSGKPITLCPECGYAFISNSSLAKHVKRVHSTS